MHAPMMMGWGVFFSGGGEYVPNLLEDAYFTSTSNWSSVDNDGTAGSIVTFGHPDESGGDKAALVEFVGSDNHHIWYDLSNPLTERAAFTFKAYFKNGPTPTTDQMQMAYYTGGDTLAEKEVSITSDWVEYEFSFIAGEDYNDQPRVRLIGWGNGSDGESVYVGRIRLETMEVQGDGEEILTDNTLYDGSAWTTFSGQDVTYGVTDSQGGSTAARIAMIGADTHQLEYELTEPLTAGRAYTITVRFQQGPAGFPEDFQIAYYDSDGTVIDREVAVPATWGVEHFSFICPEHGGAEPTIRLIGYSNGSDGQEVEIDYISLVEGTDAPI